MGHNRKIDGYEVLKECFVCGSCKGFLCEDGITIREANCPACGASRRNSDVARVIVNTALRIDDSLNNALTKLGNYSIYEAQSSDPIHDQISTLAKYTCSEYFLDVTPGSLNDTGIRCENLQNLSFSSSSFDMVIAQDVFENIREPEEAFSEIRRVLKPNGYHIFTIPLHEGKKTLKRAILKDGKDEYLQPPVYHLDPLKKDGVLVYTDFGDDLICLVNSVGFDTESILLHKWYNGEIPYIDNIESYEIYQKFKENNNILSYFNIIRWFFALRKSKERIRRIKC